MTTTNNLKDPIYGAVCVWEDKSSERAMMTVWEYDRLKKMLPKKVKIGTKIKGEGTILYEVTDVYLTVLDEPNDNKYGIDFSQVGDAGTNNITVNIVVKKTND